MQRRIGTLYGGREGDLSVFESRECPVARRWMARSRMPRRCAIALKFLPRQSYGERANAATPKKLGYAEANRYTIRRSRRRSFRFREPRVPCCAQVDGQV